jgi:methanogenic corrinoid protein MtbC1
MSARALPPGVFEQEQSMRSTSERLPAEAQRAPTRFRQSWMSTADKGRNTRRIECLDPRFLDRDDSPERKARLEAIVSAEIVPRLALIHRRVPGLEAGAVAPPGQSEIAHFAGLVLRPDGSAAERHFLRLEACGLSAENLFVDLLAPVARHLGRMWDADDCDFVDVTRGMGRLQQLLATFECDGEIPALIAMRSILMSTLPDERHSFGVAMVEKFLRACGWRVRSERVGTVDRLVETVRREWFAVVGLNVGSAAPLATLARTIERIRLHSRNAAIGVMVGGPAFLERPELAATVGADATAIDAPRAVVAAQKLFEAGLARRAGSE